MISIVSSYYNRKGLFYETLKSITKSKYKDIEFIVVDDGSDPDHRIEDLNNEFPFLKVIRLEKENKWYVNPCIPFNIGIRESKGDIIILQNPECLHIHDVLSYVNENIDNSKYLSISAYGLDPLSTQKLPQHCNNETVIDFFKLLPQQPYVGFTSQGWYNHSKYRPAYFHFCAAITRSNMKKLNGFDERYGKGIGYDDNEIIIRMQRLGLKMVIVDNVSVVHQYHDTVHWNHPNVDVLTERNRRLLHFKTSMESNYKANILKNLWNGI